MHYALKSSLFQLSRIEKGEYYLKDYSQKEHKFTSNEILENFHAVELVKPKNKTKRKSPFEIQAMAEGYAKMGELVKQSNENDENYIFEPNKSF